MYDTILVAIDASPDSPDDSLNRTTQFAKMTGGTVHLLHVARGHLVPRDITAGAALGITSVEDDADVRERQVVQNAVDQLTAAGIEVRGELIEATEHDIADVIIQRAKELDVDIIVLGYQHHRGSVVAEHVIRQHPPRSILLARPRDRHDGGQQPAHVFRFCERTSECSARTFDRHVFGGVGRTGRGGVVSFRRNGRVESRDIRWSAARSANERHVCPADDAAEDSADGVDLEALYLRADRNS